MIIFAIKKILKNKLLYIGLMLSMLMFITVSCLIPMFFNGLLGRMLVMNFNDSTIRNGTFSNVAGYQVSFSGYTDELQVKEEYYSNSIENILVKQLKQPIAYQNKIYTSDIITLRELTGHKENAFEFNNFRFFSFSSIDNNFHLVRGEFPSAKINHDNVIEVAISSDTAQIYGFILGRTYQVLPNPMQKDLNDFKIKITGIFHPILGGASTINNQIMYERGIICNDIVFRKIFIEDSSYLNNIRWHYLLDYTQLNIKDYTDIKKAEENQKTYFASLSTQDTFEYNGLEIIAQHFPQRASLMKLTLVLTLPMVLLLMFSIFFLSKLIVESDKNEISVLQSRGARTYQISLIYLIQSTFLILFPLTASPFAAVALSKLLSNTVGFLKFGDNISISTFITPTVIIFGIFAALLSLIAIIIPAANASNTNIVFRKQKASEKLVKPFWKRFNLDFIMLAVSIYGYFTYLQRQEAIKTQSIYADSMPVDPISFCMIVLFLLSMGMIYMRIFPEIIKALSRAHNQRWSSHFYASIQRVTILRPREQFIILLLILTFSFGVFSANSARTINQNTDNSIVYSGGADITIKMVPSNILEPELLEVKPSIDNFKNLEGVTEATILSYTENAQVYSNMRRNTIPINIMGVDPRSYSKVLREDGFMVDKPIDYYLNMLEADGALVSKYFWDIIRRKPLILNRSADLLLDILPMVVYDKAVISKSLAEEMDYKIGDIVSVNPSTKGRSFGSTGLKLKISAIVENWPSYTYSYDDTEGFKLEHLIVVNTRVLEDRYLDTNYRVWLKTTQDATVQNIRGQLFKKRLGVHEINDFGSQLIYSRNSAERQSINSLLTLNFIVIFIICFAAFVMYWVISIRSRVLQFGFFRAIGMSSLSVYGMLLYEQIFITLSAVVYSIFLGKAASGIFVDILRITFGADKQLLPFRLVTSPDDFTRIYLILGVMMVITYTVIIVQIKQINISKTIKLGEE